MMRTSIRRDLWRGTGEPLLQDDILLALVPLGERVPFERVYDLLLTARQVEVTSWIGVALGDFSWALFWAEDLAVSVQLQGAIRRHVLECSPTVISLPARTSLTSRLRARVLALFGMNEHSHRAPAISRLNVEREVATILDELGF